MKVKKIQLKNGYKRFHNLTIDLGTHPKRIIALVGPNGCGKSSVLDGMLYLTNAHSAIGEHGGRSALYHSMNGDGNFSSSNVIVEFVEGSFAAIWDAKVLINQPSAKLIMN